MTRLVALSHTGLYSGAEKVLERVLLRARERGWEVEALVPAGPLHERLIAAGLRVRPVPDLKLPAGPAGLAAVRLAVRTLRAAAGLRRAARGADAVLVNGLLGLPATRLARPQPPVTWLVHDVLRRPSWLRVLRGTAAAVDRAVAVADVTAAPLRGHGFPVAVVHNGTPPADPAEPPATAVVGCAAALTPWKGQDVLLEAAALLGPDGPRIALAGAGFPKDGAYVERLRRRAAEPDLAGRVEFLGRVPQPETMRTWTVLACPSVDPESCPLAVAEAMSVGLPVVATDNGGVPEILGQAGLLVPPRDPAGLAAALQQLLDDPALRARCSAAGRQAAREALDLNRQLDAVLDVVAHGVISAPG